MLVSKEQLFFVQYHFYLFLTLLLFYKIGSLEIQTKSPSQTSLFSSKHHEAAVSPPGRLELLPPIAKPSRVLTMHGQVKEIEKGNGSVLQSGQMPSYKAQNSRQACQKADSVVVMSHVRSSHVS